MSTPEPAAPLAEQPAIAIIQQLKDGLLSPKTLVKDQRQRCVEALVLEGYAYSHMAQVFHCSEKTIQRDLVELRARNAAAPPSPELAKQLIGDYLSKTEAHHAHLMRLARTKEASVAERAQAEALAAKVLTDRFDRLQSLGYLPQRPQQVMGDFIHRVEGEGGAELTLEGTEQILTEIETVGQETGLEPQVAEQVTVLRQRLEQAKIHQEAQRLLTEQQKAAESPEASNGT
jgi:transposase